MKLSKEELVEKINGLAIDDEIKITLLEDITDSMEITEPDNSELEEINTKYEELKEKYKERFLKGTDESEKEEEKEDDEELKEEEVIDVKEI
jgi:hypothetical protein